ncbi:hypothetical protein BO71DRAFT_417747 [Aspergillus ellipticus CBS 707.79]|uniref:Galactosyl transferase GMA12/MNN10 family protein n=1 Tax=Aspergillus ellipticus CBS 707.79 TaxID=1448320 RepID=A0A319DGV9_9EURO|nr:hypothetical protein BO71DRAFT_417747 [Aspergillus ellipticus CBS 707.79]
MSFSPHRWSQRTRVRISFQVALAFTGLFWLLIFFSHYGRDSHVANATSAPIIRKVRMVYGNNSVYYRALKTHEDHSRRFGYPMTVLHKPLLEGAWSKTAILLRALIEELEKPEAQQVRWLFWVDGDTVLMNPNMPLETFLPPPELSHTHLMLTEDWNGMNNGVFFIRVHQ